MRVLIVDDEDIIREGLCSSISWENLGMVVIGKAEEGMEALEFFREDTPDIVITDIKMPFMDGLELIEEIRKDYPETFIIIISGYDQFDYAQKAIKMGAFDYILKPIDIDYVEELLVKIREKYNQGKKLKEQVNISQELLQSEFLKDVMLGKIVDLDKIKTKYTELFYLQNAFYNSVMILEVDDQGVKDAAIGTDNVEVRNQVKEIVQIEEQCFVIEIDQNRIIVCCFDKQEDTIKKRLTDLSGEIRERLKGQMEMEVTVSVGFGQIYKGITFIRKSFEEASSSLENKFIMGYNQNFYYEEVKENAKRYSNLINNFDNEIIYSIDFSSKESIRVSLSELFSSMKEAGRNSSQYTKMIVSSIYMQSIKALKEVDGLLEEIFNNPIKEIEQNTKHQTIEAVSKNLLNNLYKIADYLNNRGSIEGKNNIEKVKEYINQNFHISHISINDAARYANMSVSHFSCLFKKETGLTFIDYLTSQRMEKAKYLLKASNYKTYEVSEMVGYNNSTYFSTTFKKYTSYSPSEFRKINRAINDL